MPSMPKIRRVSEKKVLDDCHELRGRSRPLNWRELKLHTQSRL